MTDGLHKRAIWVLNFNVWLADSDDLLDKTENDDSNRTESQTQKDSN